jgi:hypothetical protein
LLHPGQVSTGAEVFAASTQHQETQRRITLHLTRAEIPQAGSGRG